MFDLDFSPPEELNISLWRSLLINLADRFAPERLPPLQLTSKPVDVGILEGDLLSLPWYRTVFTNLGDVISPETLPPLELTSEPVDVGELLGDELDHPWWDSLLQNLRDRLSPEKQPALHLTSEPVALFGAESSLQILDWSTLIAGPKVFRPDAPQPASALSSYEPTPAMSAPEPPPAHPGLLAARMQLTRDIVRTRFRRKIWISLAAAEAVFLLVALFKFT
ncbi:MAG: hypothetical protein WA655_07375 [Candidatus Korobacteraceae bacterium]